MFHFFFRLICIITFSISTAFPQDKPVTQIQIKKLFKLYRENLKAGKAEEALDIAKKIYDHTPDIYGKISKINAIAVFNLSEMERYNNHKKDAAKHLQEHINILGEMKVTHDTKYLSKIASLSDSYANIHKYKEALSYGKKSLSLAKSLNKEDKIIAVLELKVGNIYYLRGNYSRARRYLKKSLKKNIKLFGKDHAKTAQIMFSLAKIDMSSRKYNKASEKLKNILKTYKKTLAPGHDRILQTHAFLVNSYSKVGNDEKSTEHCIAAATERPLDQDMEWSPLYHIRAKYPASALTIGKSGYALLNFTVNELGQVSNIKVLESTASIFEKNSIEALKKYRYAPSIKDGKRISVDNVQYKFSYIIKRMRN